MRKNISLAEWLQIEKTMLEYNEFAAEKEKEIQRDMIREVRGAFKLNGWE